jgi:hypothetical protein
MAKIPLNWDEARFRIKFNFPFPDTAGNFWIDGTDNTLVCPTLPNLTDADLLNCVFTPTELVKIAGVKNAKAIAKAIPNWATWTQGEWDVYFTANLSTTLVNAVSTTAQIRVMMNKQNLIIQNLVKLVIAMRDETWPDL